jgi:hypothetical protein
LRINPIFHSPKKYSEINSCSSFHSE